MENETVDKYKGWRDSFTKLFAEIENQEYYNIHGRWGACYEEWDEDPNDAPFTN